MTPRAEAQVIPPSRLTPPTLKPEVPAVAAIALAPAQSLEAPSGSDKVWTNIGAVSVENGFADLVGANARVQSVLEGRRATVAEIYRVAGDLERDYAAAGYVLVRVSVPPQTLSKDHPLRIVVVDGYIEGVDTAALPARARGIVAARLVGLIGRRHVKLPVIERQLLLAAATPNLQIRSTLARGAEPGGARLIVEGVEPPVSATLGVDNRLPASLGVWETTATLALNNLLGFDEQIYGSATASADPGRLLAGRSPTKILGVGAILPLGADGFSLNPEYTESSTRPDAITGEPSSRGDFQRFALRVRYPLVLSRQQTLALQGSVEHVDESLTATGFATKLYQDAYTVARAEVDWTRSLLGNGTLALSGDFSRGLGGRTQADTTYFQVPLSRQFAGPDFDKLTLEARYLQPLPRNFQLSVVVRTQASFGEAQLVGEQFSLDGADAISTVAAGVLSADQGVTLRSELSRNLAIKVGELNFALSPYGFGAFGRGSDAHPTDVEARTVSVGAAGVGLRASTPAVGFFPGGYLAVEVGVRFADATHRGDGCRVGVSFRSGF